MGLYAFRNKKILPGNISFPFWNIGNSPELKLGTLLFKIDELHYRVSDKDAFLPVMRIAGLYTLITEDIRNLLAEHVPGITTSRVQIADNFNRFLRDDYFTVTAPPISSKTWQKLDLSGMQVWKDGCAIFISEALKWELADTFPEVSVMPGYGWVDKECNRYE